MKLQSNYVNLLIILSSFTTYTLEVDIEQKVLHEKSQQLKSQQQLGVPNKKRNGFNFGIESNSSFGVTSSAACGVAR